MTSVNASLQLEFSSNIEGYLSVEIDTRDSGYNSGKTSFKKGDSPVFLVFKSPGVVIRDIKTTQGYVQDLGSGYFSVDEWLTCSMGTSLNASKPISRSLNVKATAGDPMGSYSVSGKDIVFIDPKLLVARITYESEFTAYKVTGDLGEFPVLVHVTGEI